VSDALGERFVGLIHCHPVITGRPLGRALYG
jgi:hypothetical protein